MFFTEAAGSFLPSVYRPLCPPDLPLLLGLGSGPGTRKSSTRQVSIEDMSCSLARICSSLDLVPTLLEPDPSPDWPEGLEVTHLHVLAPASTY